MNNLNPYVILFTAPALKNSRKLFQEYGLYVFSDSSESGFKEEIYKQATYIGLGERFICKADEWSIEKYVKVSLVWEIVETWSFEIDFTKEEVTKITEAASKHLPDNKILEFMQKFIEESIFSKDNWELKFWTQKKWRFIYAKSENIIHIQENILYPSKQITFLLLNVDENNKYIQAKELITTIKISENVFLDLKNKELLVKNFSENIKKWEFLMKNGMKKVSLWDDNKELYFNILKILYKNPGGFEIRDFREFDNYTELKLKEKIKGFNKGKSVKYLDFSIGFSERNYNEKSFKLYKNFIQK